MKTPLEGGLLNKSKSFEIRPFFLNTNNRRNYISTMLQVCTELLRITCKNEKLSGFATKKNQYQAIALLPELAKILQGFFFVTIGNFHN